MTANRKKKQAVRAFAQDHSVSYREALRLMGLKSIRATIRDEEGAIYWLWLHDSGLDVSWWISETESAYAVGSLSQWMSSAEPDSSSWSSLSADGRVQAAAGSQSLWEAMPFIPRDVVSSVRAFIEKQAPNWSSPSSTAIRIGELELSSKG